MAHVGAALLLGAGAALAALTLVPTPEQQVGPARISIRASLGEGSTVVRIPPFGTVSAATHHLPLRLTATLTEVDPSRIAHLAAEESDPPSRARLVGQMKTGLRRAAVHVGERLALGGLIVGSLVAALLPGRHVLGMVVGGAGGLLAVVLLLLGTARAYDVGAFEEPKFTGTLERAPDLLQAVQKQGKSLAELRSKYEIAAERLAEVVALASAPNPDPRAGSVTILHVSDIHSNPLGVEFAKQIAERFHVDAILDTGDLTSFGQPVEARIGQLLSGIGRPWLFVPGNHDSPEVRASMALVPNVVVLDQGVQTVGNVSILGWGDPTFTPGSLMTNEEARKRQLAESPKVAARVEEVAPDVLAVHNTELATASAGHVPLVLGGHNHRRSERKVRGTPERTVGSTGATGLGSFVVRSDLPYEAEILYFRDRRAVAVDYISFLTLGGDFEIQRQTLEEPEAGRQKGPAPARPGPSPALSPPTRPHAALRRGRASGIEARPGARPADFDVIEGYSRMPLASGRRQRTCPNPLPGPGIRDECGTLQEGPVYPKLCTSSDLRRPTPRYPRPACVTLPGSRQFLASITRAESAARAAIVLHSAS